MKICIGTAQFNNNYKIGSRKYFDKKKYKILRNILVKNSIHYLDTAKNYGSAERIIGNYFNYKKFKIISKLGNLYNITNIQILRKEIYRQVFDTINKTRKKKIYAFLLHDLNIIKNKNFINIYKILIEIKNKGYCNKIGISLYFEEELNEVLNKYSNLKIIQFPFNVFDQRILKKKYILRIKEQKKEIHIRSIFLRGLLLDINKVKKIKNLKYKEKKLIKKWEKNLIKENLDPIQIIFNFLKNFSFYKLIIIGIEDVDQLIDILEKKKKRIKKIINYKIFSSRNKKLILPINW